MIKVGRYINRKKNILTLLIMEKQAEGENIKVQLLYTDTKIETSFIPVHCCTTLTGKYGYLTILK